MSEPVAALERDVDEVDSDETVVEAFLEQVEDGLLEIGRNPRKDSGDLEEAAIRYREEAETLDWHFGTYLAEEPDVDVEADVDLEILEEEILERFEQALETDDESSLGPRDSILEVLGVRDREEEILPSVPSIPSIPSIGILDRGGGDADETQGGA